MRFLSVEEEHAPECIGALESSHGATKVTLNPHLVATFSLLFLFPH